MPEKFDPEYVEQAQRVSLAAFELEAAAGRSGGSFEQHPLND